MIKPIAALLVATGVVGAAVADHWSATLQPVNGSTVSGTASVDASGADSTRVTISVRGAPSNANLKWHIHSGSCAAPGGVVGSESSYPALTIMGGGTAQATANLAIKPLGTGSYAVQVHGASATPPKMEDSKPADPASAKPANADGDVISCGDLKEVMNKTPDKK